MTTISKADHGMTDQTRSKYLNIQLNLMSNVRAMHPVLHFLEATHMNPQMIYLLKQETRNYRSLTRKVIVKIEPVSEKRDLENAIRVFAAYPEARKDIILTANILGLHRVSKLLRTYEQNPIRGEQMLQELKRAEGN